MSFPAALVATGSLFAQRRVQNRVEIDFAPHSEISEQPLLVSGWSGLTLHSAEPLLRPDEEAARGGLFLYYLIMRRSGTRFLMASHHAALVEKLVHRAGLTAGVYSPSVDVQRATTDLTRQPDTYSLSAIYARVEGFGQSLRTITLYGNDLADAKLFRDMLPQIAPYRVTLRDAGTREDVLTISSRGEVGFTYRGQDSLTNVDRALQFLSRRGYLDWGSV